MTISLQNQKALDEFQRRWNSAVHGTTYNGSFKYLTAENIGCTHKLVDVKYNDWFRLTDEDGNRAIVVKRLHGSIVVFDMKTHVERIVPLGLQEQFMNRTISVLGMNHTFSYPRGNGLDESVDYSKPVNEGYL